MLSLNGIRVTKAVNPSDLLCELMQAEALAISRGLERRLYRSISSRSAA